jgi:hypothetical protein
MADDKDSQIDARVRAWMSQQIDKLQALDRDYYTIERIAELIGTRRESLSRMRKGTQGVPYHIVVNLAQLAESEQPVRLSLEPMEPVYKNYQLRQSLASGSWLEEKKIMLSTATLAAKVLPDEAFSGLLHIARRVDDNHADIFVPKGFYVLTVPYFEARSALNHNDEVVIERSRSDLSTDGASLKEVSIRRLVKSGDTWTLQSLCTTPNVVSDLPYEGETEELKILELILNRYA